MATKGKAFHKKQSSSRRYPAHCYTCEYQVAADTMSDKDGFPKVIGCLMRCEAPRACKRWRDDQNYRPKGKGCYTGRIRGVRI